MPKYDVSLVRGYRITKSIFAVCALAIALAVCTCAQTPSAPTPSDEASAIWSHDPNFTGQGEGDNEYFRWFHATSGETHITLCNLVEVIIKQGWRPGTYKGYDAITGTSYILSGAEVVNGKIKSHYLAYKSGGSPVPTDELPATLKHVHPAAQVPYSQIQGLLPDWPSKDPNFIGRCKNQYFSLSSTPEGFPTVSGNASLSAIYMRFEKASGISYFLVENEQGRYFAYEAGNPPVPTNELPADLIGPRSPGSGGSVTTQPGPAAQREPSSAATENSISNSFGNWTVTFVDEAGKKQSLKIVRPNIVGFTPQMWDDLNKNHAGHGMWLASDAGSGKVPIIDVKVKPQGSTIVVDQVIVAPAGTMAEVTQFVAAHGFVLQQ